MNQIGTRRCDFNVVPSKQPTCRRGKLEEHVINADGVLDLYADTYDEFDYLYNAHVWRHGHGDPEGHAHKLGLRGGSAGEGICRPWRRKWIEDRLVTGVTCKRGTRDIVR